MMDNFCVLLQIVPPPMADPRRARKKLKPDVEETEDTDIQSQGNACEIYPEGFQQTKKQSIKVKIYVILDIISGPKFFWKSIDVATISSQKLMPIKMSLYGGPY